MRAARADRVTPPSDDIGQLYHELFADAFRRAIEDTVHSKGLAKSLADMDFAHFADTAADIALGRSVVLRLKPELAEGQTAAIRSFLQALVRVSGNLEENRLEAAIGKLADVILPDELAPARGAIAADNLELRDRFITEVPQLTSAEIGAQAGLQTKNPYATAARWKKSGDIFSIQHRGTEYYPAFQFRDGRPHPAIKQILEAIPPGFSPWQKALWFVSSNGWLGNKTPTDMFDRVGDVVNAARREHDEVVG